MPKFSIIIPVYNVAPYLRECLGSVLSQTYTDWEAICVDDGSTDGSGAILDEYAAKDKRIRVIHQKNAGVSAARNAALDVMQGEWIWFVDADDVISPEALEQLAATVERNDFDGCYLDEVTDFSERRPLFVHKVAKVVYDSCNREHSVGILEHKGEKWVWGQPWRRLLRAEKFKTVIFPVGVRMMEDDIHFVRCLKIPARWIAIDLNIYGYRNRVDSACRSMPQERPLEVAEALLMCVKELKTIPGIAMGSVRGYVRRGSGCLNYILGAHLENPDAKVVFRCLAMIKELERGADECVLSKSNRIKLGAFRCFGKKITLSVIRVVRVVNRIVTAIEAVVDLASPEWHALAKKAKDCGSAAEFLMLLLMATSWMVVFYRMR